MTTVCNSRCIASLYNKHKNTIVQCGAPTDDDTCDKHEVYYNSKLFCTMKDCINPVLSEMAFCYAHWEQCENYVTNVSIEDTDANITISHENKQILMTFKIQPNLQLVSVNLLLEYVCENAVLKFDNLSLKDDLNSLQDLIIESEKENMDYIISEEIKNLEKKNKNKNKISAEEQSKYFMEFASSALFSKKLPKLDDSDL